MWRNQDGWNNENYFDGEISVQNIKFKGMAGVAGFEPTIARPKPAALPLGYTPSKNYYSKLFTKNFKDTTFTFVQYMYLFFLLFL